MMDKNKRDGYIAGIGTLIFGIIMLLFAWNIKITDLSGQISVAIGIVFTLLGIGSFLYPESVGQIAIKILENQQKALMGSEGNKEKNQTIHIEKVSGGTVISTVDSDKTNITIIGKEEKDNKPDIKVEISFALAAYELGKPGVPVYMISAKNFGHSPVILSGLYISLPDGTKLYNKIPIAQRLLPYKLEPGDRFDFGWHISELKATLKELKFDNLKDIKAVYMDKLENKYYSESFLID
jgi:hypothetical protein